MSEITLDPESSNAPESMPACGDANAGGFRVGSDILPVWLDWLVAQLRDWLLEWTTNPLLLVAGFSAVFGGIYALLNTPCPIILVLSCRIAMSSQPKLSRHGW